MKRLLKAVFLVTVFVLVLSCSAFAATIQLDTPDVVKEEGKKEAVVSGSVVEPVVDSQVTILVVDSSVTSLSNLTDSNIAYVNQIPVEEDGTFEFSLAINQDNFLGDSFTAYVGGTGVTSVESAPLYFGKKLGDVVGTNGEVDGEDYMAIIRNFHKDRSKITDPEELLDFDRANFIDPEGREVDGSEYMAVISNFHK